MDVRFLPLTEFHRVQFYRLITLVCLVAMAGLTLVSVFADARTSPKDALFLVVLISALAWRFALEWRWVEWSGPAFALNDELVVSHADSHRHVPLTDIASLNSRHLWLMARRYRSWSDHLAVVQLTLHSGERLYTLVESSVLAFPAGKHSVAALQAAVLAAKVKRVNNASGDNPAPATAPNVL